MGDAEEAHRRRAAPARGVKALEHWMEAHPRARVILVTVYYLAIVAGLVALYGRGDFSTPPFVYQEF